MPKEFFTPQELAERWRYKTDKRIYQLKEEIGYTQIGGRILFPIEKVEAYERERTKDKKQDADASTEEEE